MNVLVIAPHMDDEVLGCGGAIVRHVEAGDTTTVCVAANRAYGHRYDPEAIEREKDACRKARETLGYQDLVFLDLPDEQLDARLIDLIVPIEDVVQRVRPDVVYLPHRGDMNQDHRAVFEAARVACRPHTAHNITTVRVYENPSGNSHVCAVDEWTFRPTFYVDIAAALERKVLAMACYELESRPWPHPASRTVRPRRSGSRSVTAACSTAIRRLWGRGG